ncbi:hypothetical protein D8674_035304 [Pyrus ussuriensis x Pyrus communis]|uniref:Uncharacterized protein n=1 Tax=Pyrus ussuriensis x Pyrus communis TaxID=2448454 RepID=A0A5N5GCF5_9ROSA|nr:hypothetical protein D8674_035304 [Pyrus ussuriensis x Pyrus communis]
MSHLIRTRRSVTSTPSLMATPSLTTTLTTAATIPAEMDHRLANPVGSPIPQVQASSTSSMVAYRADLLPYVVEVLEGDAGGDEEQGARSIVRADLYGIDVFADFYVWPENELTDQLVLQESASQLPSDTLIQSVDPLEDARFQIVTETLDQTFGRRPGTYC